MYKNKIYLRTVAYVPQGVHVGHVVIDGAIDSPWLRAQFAEQDIPFLDPGDIADAYMMLAK